MAHRERFFAGPSNTYCRLDADGEPVSFDKDENGQRTQLGNLFIAISGDSNSDVRRPARAEDKVRYDGAWRRYLDSRRDLAPADAPTKAPRAPKAPRPPKPPRPPKAKAAPADAAGEAETQQESV